MAFKINYRLIFRFKIGKKAFFSELILLFSLLKNDCLLKQFMS